MKKLHRYLGLCLSIIVLIVSLTGVMLVWKREYLWVTIPAARELKDPNTDYANVTRTIETHYSANSVQFVRFFAEGLSVHKVYLAGRRYAWHDQTGAQVQVWSGNERFEDWLLDLHHRLLLGNKIGLQWVGFTGLLLLPLMIIGTILWWPWRRSYRANLVPASGKAGALRKSHFDTGITVLVPTLLIAVTGVILVYPNQAATVIRDRFGETVPPITESLVQRDDSLHSNRHLAFDFVHTNLPDARVRWFSYPNAETGDFTIGVQEAESWNRMGASSLRFELDRVLIKHAQEQSLGNTVLSFSYPLHVGKFPTLYRLALSAFGLLLAWLALLGLISYRKNAQRNR